jgi:hypothetical protein
VAASTAAGAQSPAEKYPEKPIKIIVPFAPGGSVDVLAFIRGEIDKWSPLIRQLGLKME